jgi:hypothetical protein
LGRRRLAPIGVLLHEHCPLSDEVTGDRHGLVANPARVVAQVENDAAQTVSRRGAECLTKILSGALPKKAHVYMRQVRTGHLNPVDAARHLDRCTSDVHVPWFLCLTVTDGQGDVRPRGSPHQVDDLVQIQTSRITPVYMSNPVIAP